jgi:hypothetical protein
MQAFHNPFSLQTFPLPWESQLDVPEYRDYKGEEWSLKLTAMPPLIRGYYTDIHSPKHKINPILSRNGKTWMSITPMELESQAPHAHFATGHTVIAGLGMGVLTYNVLRKPEVTKVTVLEQSADVIKLFPRITNPAEWDGIEKLEIVHTDATEWVAKEEVDFMAVDIFEQMFCSTSMDVLKKMQKNVRAFSVAGWTIELEFVSWAQDAGIPPDDLEDRHYDQFCAEHRLPLITWPGIAHYCLAVAYHTSMY